jgi:hypothetical protein
MDQLAYIKSTSPGSIAEDVAVYEEFGNSRSFRRGATSTARARGVAD